MRNRFCKLKADSVRNPNTFLSEMDMAQEADEESNFEELVSQNVESLENPTNLDCEVNREEEEEVSGGDKILATVCDRGVRGREGPPADDVCPICFGDFELPCKTSCGHWFCASCILMLWNYSHSVARCKCPVCSRLINKLTPEASLVYHQEEEIVKILKKVEVYNCLFVGGTRGLLMKVRHLPLSFRAFCRGLLDLDRFTHNVNVLRITAILLAILYDYLGSEFIPIGSWGYRSAASLFEDLAWCLLFVLYVVGLCRRYMLRRRVRLLDNPQQ